MSRRWSDWLRHAAIPVLVFLASLAPLALSTSAVAAPVLSLGAPGGSVVQVGSIVRIELSVTGLTNAAGFSIGLYDLDLLYSSSLRFVGGNFNTAGPGSNPLSLTEASAPPFVGDFVDLSGRIDVFGLSGNSQSVLDALQANDIVLFDLIFEALNPDVSAFVRIDLSDPFLLVGFSDPGVALMATFDPSNLGLMLVQGQGTIPEPSTWALAGLAFAGLVATRRRVKALNSSEVQS